uniref:Peptidase S1 domain-containing protein n=1 Tax=Varanus komodoensis TaxID=61221 RepID=A0A8D2IWV7_VARKO
MRDIGGHLLANPVRVVGGQECEKDGHRWLGLLQTEEGPYCGVALISQNWVLSAAHCYESHQGHGQYQRPCTPDAPIYLFSTLICRPIRRSLGAAFPLVPYLCVSHRQVVGHCVNRMLH